MESDGSDNIRPIKEPRLGKKAEALVQKELGRLAKVKEEQGPIAWARSIAAIAVKHDTAAAPFDPVKDAIFDRLQLDIAYIQDHSKLFREYTERYQKEHRIILEDASRRY